MPMSLPTNPPRRGFFRTLRDVVVDADWHPVALIMAFYLIGYGLGILSPDATAVAYEKSLSWAPPHMWSFLTISSGAGLIAGIGFRWSFVTFIAAVAATGIFSSISAAFWFAGGLPTGGTTYAISAAAAGIVAWRFAESPATA